MSWYGLGHPGSPWEAQVSQSLPDAPGAIIKKGEFEGRSALINRRGVSGDAAPPGGAGGVGGAKPPPM